MTAHAALVQIAGAWLKRRHPLVITEMAHGSTETPDAIGFTCKGSTLVECKASRSDFLADGKKFFRRNPDRGMGNYRYYMAPKGLISIEDLPPNWGLVEVNDQGKPRKKHKATYIWLKNSSAEQSILVSLIRRIGHERPEGVAVKVYVTPIANPQASAFITPEEPEDG